MVRRRIARLSSDWRFFQIPAGARRIVHAGRRVVRQSCLKKDKRRRSLGRIAHSKEGQKRHFEDLLRKTAAYVTESKIRRCTCGIACTRVLSHARAVVANDLEEVAMRALSESGEEAVRHERAMSALSDRTGTPHVLRPDEIARESARLCGSPSGASPATVGYRGPES